MRQRAGHVHKRKLCGHFTRHTAFLDEHVMSLWVFYNTGFLRPLLKKKEDIRGSVCRFVENF